MIKERHLFPGNNTPKGFYSYYHHILPQQRANHIFCLKGGPGVGKSTLMKRIGQTMQQKDYAVEYLHCSSDPGSLDGILIPAIRVAVLDGTAPHVVDPINPGAVDEIINLGEFWDADGIKQNKEKVMQVNAGVGRLFKRAYRYIAAAKPMMDDAAAIYEQAADYSGLAQQTQTVISSIFDGHEIEKLAAVRKQFASAITPLGVVHYLDTLFDDSYRAYKIKSHYGIGVSDMLKRISDEAIIRGIDTEQYFCPMEPETKIEHIILPQLKLAFVTESKYLAVNRCDAVIDLSPYINDSFIKDNAEFVNTAVHYFEALLNQAIATLQKAKSAHDELETYYIPHMDFDRLNRKNDEIVSRILAYAK